MKRSTFFWVAVIVCISCSTSMAIEVTIYNLQYVSDLNDTNSPYNLQLVDCTGGIVTSKSRKSVSSPWRITVQDVNEPNEWGGIHVKDLDGTGVLDTVSVGDEVYLSNMFVEEFRGTTFLQCITSNNPQVTVVSTDNTLPDPITVGPNDIAAPQYNSGDDSWFVKDYQAEKYEGMLLKVEQIEIVGVNQGKADDNYVLADANDPCQICWASDFANVDRESSSDYHEYITLGQFYCDITGILEQYTKRISGWDYYQLLTRKTGDIRPELEADITGDCAVDFEDLAVIGQYWLRGK